MTRSPAERLLWEALRAGLPDGWRAWHSLRLRGDDGWEGEGDFVLAAPGHGLVVLEVKGGRLKVEDGRWFQNGREIGPPRDQAQRFVRNLVKRLERDGVPAPPFGVACAFPETGFGSGPGGELEGVVLGERDLGWLNVALPPLVRAAIGPRPPPTDDRWIEALHGLWGETWIPTLSLRDRVDDAAERLVGLDAEQLELLEGLEPNADCRVEGPAGSGKTVLARELCRRAASAGRRVLYLCFTDALAGAVGAGLPFERARASSVRGLAASLTEGLAGSRPWPEVLVAAAEAAGREAPFDLVVVDEAQDLEPADWSLVQVLARAGGLWTFGDPRQRFWLDRDVPEGLRTRLKASYRLRRQHRNPPDVARLGDAYGSGALEPLPAGEERTVVIVSASDTRTGVERALAALFDKGAAPHEVAVVSPAGQTRTRVGVAPELAGHRCVRADDPAAATSLVADTFLRFKGLERPFVVVAEGELALADRYSTRMHIAVTRATAGLVVVATPEVLSADPHLAALAARG